VFLWLYYVYLMWLHFVYLMWLYYVHLLWVLCVRIVIVFCVFNVIVLCVFIVLCVRLWLYYVYLLWLHFVYLMWLYYVTLLWFYYVCLLWIRNKMVSELFLEVAPKFSTSLNFPICSLFTNTASCLWQEIWQNRFILTKQIHGETQKFLFHKNLCVWKGAYFMDVTERP
jgi:hypothetical protein